MGGYKPLYISGNKEGLIQNRQEFILPNDAYPILENAFIFREQIRRKQGYTLLGRLRRNLSASSIGNISAGGAGTVTLNIFTALSLANQPQAELQVGSQTNIVITIGAPISQTLTDSGGLGSLIVTGAGPIASATINYATGVLSMVFTGAAAASAATFTGAYYPTLPVMGIRYRDLSPINAEMTVFFDTQYAYNFSATGFVEFIPGTTWSAGLPNANSNFFWSTNYWVSSANVKIFWATNFSGPSGDPIRYTDGVGNGTGAWVNFAPKINSIPSFLTQALVLVPFRGRLMAFNTLEGANLAASVAYTNRIRWAAIGTPFDVSTIAIPVSFNQDAWRDDIRGQGGFLDIPTNEDIIAVGFVRDNLVIYCENSTWQLRYTGRTIAPFQIEKVNTELGSGSTFSAVQFDTSLVGIGDKGVVECDSFKSQRIDIKIPDLVMNHFNNRNNGSKRVHGVRDFLQRLAFWTYPETDNQGTFPDRRLVYNYENDSWAIFTDSLTTLGTYQPTTNRTWANPSGGLPTTKVLWKEANFTWGNQPQAILSIVGGNQQGYVEYLDKQTTNDPSLTIQTITGNTTTPTQIGSVNHNLQTGTVIKITDIPAGTGYASSLNDGIFGIVVTSSSAFLLYKYDPNTGQFSDPQLDAPATYIGGGQISVRDNFRIVSKKFNYLDDGQNIQMGYVDILMDTTDAGAISLYVYINYDDNTVVNQFPNNQMVDSAQPDSFFNVTIPTIAIGNPDDLKSSQRVYCPARGNYLTLEYTLSNAQMNGIEQESDVQIDMQVLWTRAAGRIGAV